MTPENFNKVIFLQISGVSMRYVKEIQKYYPTVKDLILKYESLEEDKRHDLLSDLTMETSTGKKRKFGFIMSKRIYDFFYP